MSFIDNSEFENKDCKDVLERIINVNIDRFCEDQRSRCVLQQSRGDSIKADSIGDYVIPRKLLT